MPTARAQGAQSLIVVGVAITGQTSLGPNATTASDVSGGQFVAGRTITPQLSTPSYVTPLVIKRETASPTLLKLAAQQFTNPGVHASVDVKWFKGAGVGMWTLAQEGQYAEAVVSRLDFPANYGTAVVNGPFVLTASVAKSTMLPSSAQIIPTPPVDPLPTGVSVGSTLRFVLQIDGLPNVGDANRAPPLTFDGFSLTPANLSGGLTLTVHAALASYDLGKWSQAHPSGANAYVKWGYPAAGTTSVQTFQGAIQLTGVTVGSSSVDAPAVAGGTPTSATAQVKARQVSMVLL